MVTNHDMDIPRVGIPLNLGIAACIGLLVGYLGEGVEFGMSTGVLIGITLGFFLQEALLVQILSRDANIRFQHRILKGQVTSMNRRLLLTGPVLLLLGTGFLLALVNNQVFDPQTIARIICVSLIVMFGIDPLFGLVDRGVLAIFGASVVYIIILQAGFDGYEQLADTISPYIGNIVAISIASSVVTYLLLSARWTYYRLFCFNQLDDLGKVFADTGLPLLLVLLPYFPQFVELLEAMFLGI
jgi:hypothetical protein